MINEFQYDLYQLAVAVLYLNLDRAVLDFPTLTRAHPSYKVFVGLSPKGPVIEDHRKLFPMQVRWDIWQRVVVPVFVDGSVLVKVGVSKNTTLRQWINREYLNGDMETLLLKIGQMLLSGLQEGGYVPAGIAGTGLVSPPAEPGAPVVPIGGSSPYQQFD
jgi:hypothetical protein